MPPLLGFYNKNYAIIAKQCVPGCRNVLKQKKCHNTFVLQIGNTNFGLACPCLAQIRY